MAKAKKNIMEERIVKSLTTAAKTLNKKMHQPFAITNIAALNNIDGEGVNHLVKVFQVFCPDEGRVITPPTTDEAAAREFRDEHNLTSGHNSRVLVSN